MKKNTKTYVLLLAVLGIWGVIGYKIVATINPSKEKKAQNITQVTFNPKGVKERDTFSLILDYRDPFLGTIKRLTNTKIVKKKATPKVVIPKRIIQYTVFIANKSSRPTVFFITIDGQQQMMSINDVHQKVKLVYGTKEKIKVKENGVLKTIDLTE